MTKKIERIDIKEFRSFGFLQEVNRQFFHPLGLALEVIINDGDGSEKLGGVWDYRDAPEGIVYVDDLISTLESKVKVDNVKKLLAEKVKVRKKKFGFVVQPIISDKERNK